MQLLVYNGVSSWLKQLLYRVPHGSVLVLPDKHCCSAELSRLTDKDCSTMPTTVNCLFSDSAADASVAIDQLSRCINDVTEWLSANDCVSI